MNKAGNLYFSPYTLYYMLSSNFTKLMIMKKTATFSWFSRQTLDTRKILFQDKDIDLLRVYFNSNNQGYKIKFSDLLNSNKWMIKSLFNQRVLPSDVKCLLQEWPLEILYRPSQLLSHVLIFIDANGDSLAWTHLCKRVM